MAWNRPANGEADSCPLNEGRSSFNKRTGVRFPIPVLRGIFAALIVVGGIVAGLVFFSGREADVQGTPRGKERRAIREATPSIVTNIAKEETKDPPGYWNGKPISEENRPPWMSPYHRIVDYGPIHTVKVDRASLTIGERVFSRGCDQQIADMLLSDPGDYFLGDVKGLYDGFDDDFVESLKEPIIVTSNDTDEEKELKRAVNQVKVDLKARLDAGENLQKIMEDNWNQMRELGLYKEELAKQVEEVAAKSVEPSEADIDDCIAAANKMLAERGCTPLRSPALMKERILMKIHSRNVLGTSEEDDE